jgi:peptidoglycan/xylan/chitin deacetylase (PgdA/CDA1 family)
VALTFDACSTRKHGKYDRRITDILVATRTPATIFLGGKWMEEHPEAAAELSGNPLFELGNHSYTHPHLLRLTDSAVKNELLAAERVLEQLTGKRTSIFRAPFGEVDERVSRIAAECGMLTVQYDLASGDPDTNATAEKLIEYVIRRARNGSIIVMHINGRGWHTAEALPEIVSRLKARGFVFVTVSELIGRHSALTR